MTRFPGSITQSSAFKAISEQIQAQNQTVTSKVGNSKSTSPSSQLHCVASAAIRLPVQNFLTEKNVFASSLSTAAFTSFKGAVAENASSADSRLANKILFVANLSEKSKDFSQVTKNKLAVAWIDSPKQVVAILNAKTSPVEKADKIAELHDKNNMPAAQLLAPVQPLIATTASSLAALDSGEKKSGSLVTKESLSLVATEQSEMEIGSESNFNFLSISEKKSETIYADVPPFPVNDEHSEVEVEIGTGMEFDSVAVNELYRQGKQPSVGEELDETSEDMIDAYFSTAQTSITSNSNGSAASLPHLPEEIIQLSKIGLEAIKQESELQDSDQVEFKLGQRLGSGAFGEVHLVSVKGSEKQYAAKELALSENPGTKFEDFVAEALNLSRLPEHENLVRSYGIQEIGGKYMILMEYVPGSSLESILKNNIETLQPAEQLLLLKHMSKEILTGLDALNNANLVHEDLASKNVMVTSDGKMKLVDFGLAAEKGADLTERKLVPQAYVDPTFLFGKLARQASFRNDTFSLSRLLFGDARSEINTWGQTANGFVFKGPIFKPGFGNYGQLAKLGQGKAQQAEPEPLPKNIQEVCDTLDSTGLLADFVMGLSQPNKEHRLNAADALKHPLLKDFNPSQDEIDSVLKKLNSGKQEI